MRNQESKRIYGKKLDGDDEDMMPETDSIDGDYYKEEEDE